MTDQTWLETYSNGNVAAALDHLYRSYGKVEGWIINHGGSPDEARDVFQEALVVLCKQAAKPGFTLQTALEAYFFGICRHLWFAQVREKTKQQQVHREASRETAAPAVEDHQAKESRFKALDAAMSALSATCREVLTLFYLRKASMRVIAQQLGLKGENAAKTRKYKCLEAAKKLAQQAVQTNENAWS